MWIDRQFPALAAEGYEVTSEPDGEYNCIAYAAGETDRWWSHLEDPGYYWPAYARRTAAIQSLVEVFTGLGYELCADAGYETGWQKVALYAKDGEWKHAATQLPNGDWSSKLGLDEDIRHRTPESLAGDDYGQVHCLMRRKEPDGAP